MDCDTFIILELLISSAISAAESNESFTTPRLMSWVKPATILNCLLGSMQLHYIAADIDVIPPASGLDGEATPTQVLTPLH